MNTFLITSVITSLHELKRWCKASLYWLPWLLFMISSSRSRHWHLIMTHLHVMLHDHTGLNVDWGTYMWTRFGSVPSPGGRLPFRELLFMCLDKQNNQESVQVVSLRHHKLWAAILTSRHTQPKWLIPTALKWKDRWAQFVFSQARNMKHTPHLQRPGPDGSAPCHKMRTRVGELILKSVTSAKPSSTKAAHCDVATKSTHKS